MIAPRQDVLAALSRSGPRTRELQRELAGLGEIVPPGEFIAELELGWVGQEAGLLVLTTGRLLFVSTMRPVHSHYALPLDQIVDVVSQVGPDGSGMLSVQIPNARIDVLGVTASTRFRDVIAARRYGTPGSAAQPAYGHQPAPLPPLQYASPKQPHPSNGTQSSGGPELVIMDDGEDFEILDVFSLLDPDQDPGEHQYFTWGAIIRNPRDQEILEYPEVKMTARTARGSIAASSESSVYYAVPGGHAVIVGSASVDEIPVRMEFLATEARWERTSFTSDQFLPFPCVNVEWTARREDGLRITGEVVNPFGGKIKDVRVRALVRDRATNAVIGTDADSVDIGGDGRGAFDMTLYNCHCSDAESVDVTFQAVPDEYDAYLKRIKAVTPQPSAAQPTAPQPTAPPLTDQRVSLPALSGLVRAEEVIARFVRAGLPVTITAVYDEETDPNGHIGRPNSYFAKANWADARVPSEKTEGRDDDDSGLGGSVELFRTPQEAEDRADYIARINAAAPFIAKEYHLIAGAALIRLSYNVPSKYTGEYAAALQQAAPPSQPQPQPQPPIVLPPPTRPFSADEFVWAIRELGVPVGLIIVYTPQTDPIIGRPGGYLGKAQFADRRIPRELLDHLDRDDLRRGGSVELFATPQEAVARSAYVRTGEHHFVVGSALIRLTDALDPAALNSYAEALSQLGRQ